jgi:hypothetical protein
VISCPTLAYSTIDLPFLSRTRFLPYVISHCNAFFEQSVMYGISLAICAKRQVVNTTVKQSSFQQCLRLLGFSFPAVDIFLKFKLCGQAAFDSQELIRQLFHMLTHSTLQITKIGSVWAGYCSRYSDWLRAGRSGDRIPVCARFYAPVQTGPGAHPDSCTMGTGSFPGIESGRGVTLAPHPLLVPKSKNRVALYLYSP